MPRKRSPENEKPEEHPREMAAELDDETDEMPTDKLEIDDSERLAQEKAIERANAIRKIAELNGQIHPSVKNIQKI